MQPATAKAPSPRRITGWIMRPLETMSEANLADLEQVRAACPDIAEACDLARAFTDMLRKRRGELLEAWLDKAEHRDQSALRSLAASLRQDIAPVRAGLTLPYSSGIVEGHVGRLKAVKRSMFNRAGLPLLRKRILLL